MVRTGEQTYNVVMSPSLREEIHQRKPFASAAEEAFLNLQRTAGLLMRDLGHQLRQHAPKGLSLSLSQYNVLRILRGAHPDSLPCGTVGDRLVTPVPDVTRLIDRLERHGMAERHRDEQDRRVVRVRITDAALALLSELDGVVRSWLDHHIGHLPEAELEGLSQSLENLRHGPDD